MVAHNPLTSGRWTLKKFNATVINDIWPEVLFFSLVATMVSLVSQKTSTQLSIPNGLLTVLGTVLGLVISFRTSSAYERYQDGRKMWTNISTSSRNLAQMIWIHVSNVRENKGPQKQQTELQSVIEKKTMINIIQAFAVSVKHFLRGEQGVYYEDLYPLICFLPRYANADPRLHHHEDKLPLWHTQEEDGVDPRTGAHTPLRSNTMTLAAQTQHSGDGSYDDKAHVNAKDSVGSRGRSRKNSFDPEMALPFVESEHSLEPSRNPPKTTLYDYIPLLRFFKWCVRVILRRAGPKEQRHRKLKVFVAESNVPLELLLILSNSLIALGLMKAGLLQPAIAAGITGNLTSLQDTVANLERICNTPLPFAYQAHLRMSLWLYLFFLPFQIWSSFKYITIPGTAFASFLLLGFLEIGQEIENPFNYDLNDLDLDGFCLALQRELNEITANTLPEPASFVFSPLNQPFAPSDRRAAAQLVATGGEYRTPEDNCEPGDNSIKRTLVKSWKEVDRLTRKQH
ncbi:Bestrophin, RFP-TM, chloride channel-domain-containing protein [Cyathus striatus]|nr:Bestrophin, RFP-TM, chloride channel-domain-containing protein [Cyathus striatus]